MSDKIGIKRLDHVCWAVRKLEDALPLLTELMGMREVERWEDEEKGYRGVSLEVPGGGTGHFELMESRSAKTATCTASWRSADLACTTLHLRSRTSTKPLRQSAIMVSSPTGASSAPPVGRRLTSTPKTPAVSSSSSTSKRKLPSSARFALRH
jgi:hypothetical protein